MLEVWRFDLDTHCPDENATRSAWQMLDAEERKRASAFVFAVDRRRFIAGRSLLRILLGRCLDLAPAEVRLRYSSAGKPFLDPAHGGGTSGGALNFNLSHSGQVGYVAVLNGEPVGIDVEQDRAIDDVMVLARTVFSAQEMAELRSRDRSEQNPAFLHGWTRKEAVVKLLGTGLGVDLQAITVGLSSAAALLDPISGISDLPVRVCTLPARAGEYAAVAYTGPVREIVVHSEPPTSWPVL